MDDSNNKNGQISYDARQGRSQLLLNWLARVSEYQAQDNYMDWLKALRSIVYLASPYVAESESAPIKEALLKTQNIISFYYARTNKIDVSVVFSSLDNLTNKILFVFRDQFMQMNQQEVTDFNEDDLLD